MNSSSSTFKTLPLPLSCSFSTKPNHTQLKIPNTPRKKPLTCTHSNPQTTTTKYRLHMLVSEFKSLPQPIDRVKRLLDYATILPAQDESLRVQTNKVNGCTTQVWLDVVMDERGKMRFRADSDSEITKGFCSCLVMVFDGAEPEEVLDVKREDLTEMNVSVVNGKMASRVNTWHNVLIVMQKRTRCLVREREANYI